GVGDQNGDGRSDVAFRDMNSVKAVYTPADPAGAIVDASNLGNGGFTLNCPGDNPTNPHLGDLGDINGDGRDDLAVTWEDPGTHTVYAVGAISPDAGSVVDLGTVAGSH